MTVADALYTKTQQKIMALLFTKPDTSYYLNEIVRLAGMGKGTIKRELEKMTNAELLTLHRVGNQNHYQANPASPIYHELVAISLKTFGIADILKRALQPIDDVIRYAFIYGSIAKGSSTAKSDIDLMIITDKELAYTDAMNLLMVAEDELQRPINPSIYTLQELTEKMNQKNSFITRILEQEKIKIKGDMGGINKA